MMYSSSLARFLTIFIVILFPFLSYSQDCDLDFSFTNTGSNMIIMISDAALENDILNNGDSIGAFIYLNDDWLCVGSIEWNGLQQTLAVWGNDAVSDFQDGLMAMDTIVLKAQSEGVLYNVSYSPKVTFEVNGIAILNDSFEFTPYCDDIGSIYGCTDSTYNEYNPQATIDDGTCESIDIVYGCTISSYVEYNPNATVYDGSCETFAIFGCMDSNYLEFNSDANVDDGSCDNIIIEGCTNENYIEYNSDANVDDGSCDIYIIYGCTNVDYIEFSVTANTDDGSCYTPVVLGCMNDLYLEYNPEANTQDTSCNTFIIYGCMDTEAFNYNDNATVDDESCIAAVYGCTISSYLEYNPDANTNDGSCIAVVFGCTNEEMFNYNVNANTDDNSCGLNLPSGWSMFGYTCLESKNVVEVFSEISNSIEIVKDEWGLAYLPSWGFSAFDNLVFAEGYQIKMIEEVTGFNLCVPIISDALNDAYAEGAASVTPEDGISQADVDAAVAEVQASFAALLSIGDFYQGGIVFQINEDGTGLVAAMEDLTDGATANGNGNYGYEWGCAYNSVDGADGTAIGTGYQNTMDIVNQDCTTDWGGITAAQAAANYESNGYNDWYIPSIDELLLMFNTIGPGADNIVGIETIYPNNIYWSSSEVNGWYEWSPSQVYDVPYIGFEPFEYPSMFNLAYHVAMDPLAINPDEPYTDFSHTFNRYKVRVIRAF